MKPDTRPLNVGHRGARALAPENTLAGFRKALEVGADGVEFDVMLSRDGQVVVIHDETVDRTTDGSGPVAELTLADLKALDAGRKFSEAFAGEPIPTLDEVLDLVQGMALINIELKCEDACGPALAEKVVPMVRRRRLGKQVILSSFAPQAIVAVKRLAPELRTGFLYSDRVALPLSPTLFPKDVHPDAVHPASHLVTAEYVQQARTTGYSVNTWTVNQVAEMHRLIDLGVHSIITDRPDLLRQVLLTDAPPARHR